MNREKNCMPSLNISSALMSLDEEKNVMVIIGHTHTIYMFIQLTKSMSTFN